MEKKKNFYNALPPPNTFIGGVGFTSITSKTDYANISNLSVSQIRNFVKDINGNVSFYVSTDYILTNKGFGDPLYLDNALTYFLDVDGHITNASSLSQGMVAGVNLKYAYFPSIENITTRRFLYLCTSLRRANIGMTSSNFNTARCLADADLIERIELPNMVTWNQGNNAFFAFDSMNGGNLKRIYMPNLNSADSFVYNNAVDITSNKNFFNNTGSGCKVYYDDTKGLGNTTRFAFMNVSSGTWNAGETFIFNGLTYTAVNGAPTTDGEFQTDVANNGIRTANVCNAIQNDTRVGTIHPKPVTCYRTNLAHFIATTAGQAFADTITWDFSAYPAKFFISNIGPDDTGFIGGNDVHPLLIHLRDQLGFTLVPISAPIAVNAPTGLGYVNLTASTVDLTFTEPTPNANGTDAYEVWADDGSLWRRLFYFDEIVGSGATLDLSIITSEGFNISGTKLKIRTIDNHFNLSDFSNEITLP